MAASSTSANCFAGRSVMSIVLSAIIFTTAGYCQIPRPGLRTILIKSCSFNDDHLARLVKGEVVISTLKARDKKDVSLCGAVRLDRTAMPTIEELEGSFKQETGRSVMAGGEFGRPPTKLDLRGLRLEKKDIEALLQCKPGKCSLLVSDALLETLTTRSSWQTSDLEDLYAEDLVEFVRAFSVDGLVALNTFQGLSVTSTPADQNRGLIDRTPLRELFDPALLQYLKEYPKFTLPNGQTRLSWSKVSFGLKPVITITSTTVYLTSSGRPVLIPHQIYSSRYMNGSVAIATVMPDETGALYLVFGDISRSDALGGLLGGIKRTVVVSEGEKRAKDLLGASKARLDLPVTQQTTQTVRFDDDLIGSRLDSRTSRILVIAGTTILIVTLVWMAFLWRYNYRGKSATQAKASTPRPHQGPRSARPIG